MFDTDVHQVIDSFDRFQELLAVVLERPNLPQSYIFERGESGRELTPRSEEEEEIGEDTTDFMELVGHGPELARDAKKFSEWARAVKQRAGILRTQFDEASQKVRAVEGAVEQCVHNYEQMLGTERSTNATISAEIQRLQDALYERDREVTTLQRREEDKEFKQCLRDVAIPS
jgi:predicted RNase H-like nuclease (RuvC/YqgF family)